MVNVDSHGLVKTTIELIQNRSVKVKLNQISGATGIPEAWISLFAQGKIIEPSANRVLKLYEYMSGETAEEFFASKK